MGTPLPPRLARIRSETRVPWEPIVDPSPRLAAAAAALVLGIKVSLFLRQQRKQQKEVTPNFRPRQKIFRTRFLLGPNYEPNFK